MVYKDGISNAMDKAFCIVIVLIGVGAPSKYNLN